jgi:hypothetical protein
MFKLVQNLPRAYGYVNNRDNNDVIACNLAVSQVPLWVIASGIGHACLHANISPVYLDTDGPVLPLGMSPLYGQHTQLAAQA